jgi:hypothetical protein
MFQRGYVLITVLVLTFVASMVVFASIRENQLQERMGGNQQKMINARLAAEKGIADTLALIKTRLAAGDDVPAIVIASNREVVGSYTISQTSYSQPRLTFISQGIYQDATASLKASLNLVIGKYPFNGGVVSCEQLTLQGSGKIDSYDPTRGGYDSASNAQSNSKVMVINSGANENVLDGHAPIGGDVQVNGSLKLTGSSAVSGHVTTTGNLTLSGGKVSTGSADVGGNLVLAEASREVAAITGQGNVAGNVTASPNAKVGALSYGGTLTNKNEQSPLTATTGALVRQPTPAPTLPSQECDPLNLQASTANYANLTSSGTLDGYHYKQSSYTLTPSGAALFADATAANDQGAEPQTGIRPQEVMVMGESTQAYVLDKLSLQTSTLNISGGDVTLIVKGDFLMGGGKPSINVASGSSLTILVQGQTHFDSDGALYVADAGAAANQNKPPLSIYSSNSSANGVVIEGAFGKPNQVAVNSYAAIYAPYTHVDIKAAGSLSGAVRGKTVSVSGAGGLHYDESLDEVNKNKNSRKIVLASVFDRFD